MRFVRPTLVGLLALALSGGCSLITDFDNDQPPGSDAGTDASSDADVANDGGTDADTPVCNNDGIPDLGEQCDDGNPTPWDGCHECRYSEVRANASVQGDQERAAVAALPSGAFLVAWVGPGATSGNTDIYAKLYDPTGAVRVEESRLTDPDQQANQTAPSAAAVASHVPEFVVVWQSDSPNPSVAGVQGATIAATNGTQNPLFQINDDPGTPSESPMVATRDRRGFIVVWAHLGPLSDIRARLYDDQAQPDGTAIPIADSATLHLGQPAVGALSDGDFWAAWVSHDVDNDVEIRQFAYDGTPLASSLIMYSPSTVNDQTVPRVAGGFASQAVVTWDSANYSNGQTPTVFAQRCSDTGGLSGNNFEVNGATGVHATGGSGVTLSDGSFTLFWTGRDEHDSGIFGRRYDSDGGELDAEPVLINTAQQYDQQNVAVAFNGTNYLVCWQASNQDGDGQGVYCTRLDAALQPLELAPPIW